ncbi:MAG: long-chain fatty acid transporter, partial [Proteobacteria bacterium]
MTISLPSKFRAFDGVPVEYKDNWIGQFVLNRLQLQTIFVQPTVSYAFSDKVSIGAGFVYAFGKVNLQRTIPLSDADGYGKAELDGKAQGFGYNVGIYVKPADILSIGVSYRSKVDMKVEKGDAKFDVPASTSSLFAATQFDASLPMPSSLNIGIGVTPTDKLTIAADVNFIGWSAYESLDFDYNGNVGGAGITSSSSPRKYENSYALRLGTQYMVADEVALRLGAYYDKTPVEAGFMTAETPDSDRIGITGGLGYKPSDNFSLD